jgi:cytochrome b
VPIKESSVNATSASLAEHAASPTGGALPSGGLAPSRRTVDAPTRVFHWLMALCFAGAYATAEGERWRLVHVTLGYSLVGLLGFRIVWGLVGPKPARFSSWWGKLKALPGLVSQLQRGQWPATGVQNLGMSLAVVGVLLSVVLTTTTGWITYQAFTGEWMQEVHEFAGNLLLAIVLGHIALVLGLSALRRRNLVMPMLSGRTPGRGPDLVRRNRGWLAALMLVAVLGFWAWQWQGAPAGGGLDGAGGAQQGYRSDHDDDDD